MAEKTHWKKLDNPDYLGAWSFQPGEEKIVTIKEVKRQLVFNVATNGKEECTVAYFVEDVKPLILNVTNCKAISKAWGTPYIDDWPGRKIALRVKRVKAFGEMTDAVRVSPDRPTEETFRCELCGNEITPAAGQTAAAIASATKNKYGKQLCLHCAKERIGKSNG